MVRQDYERQRLAARSELEQSFYEVSTFDQAIRINQRIHAQLTDMLKAATAKYAVGSGLLQDSIRAQVEIGKLDSSRFEFERKLATARAKVNRLVNRALDAPVATVTLPRMRRR